ncbi:hypothetical protein FPF71_11265 [Algibacter amylolyticus]|uniref:Uncharacterized protein n=1 Tax=Algibacter amylolyticus TaxID=1608400 RepID=A0A5M7B9K3_9FLAO|nr:DUF6090 family protein [Algibacter amylolyticus]KAA5824184.1 hypothetical protein F2B50_11265 [Algibacter amylolyticus]MBB5269744.1 hypothetical protein [Algibacter amylolyticus]TSJ74661.1 hypothetical protein FPF71_11265 [Algibacter amylolyticus]
MIKFFRKIRQRLLTENKFSKYLLYAVGEIVLVVIGILIALQINNNNKYNEQRSLEQEYLLSLKAEFETNLNKINASIQENEQRIESLDNLSTLFNKNVLDTINNQAISQMFAPVLGSQLSYLPSTGVLNDIISSGKLNIILNKSLRQNMASFESSLDFLNIQLNEANFYDDNLRTLLYNKGSVRNIISDIGFMDFENESISGKVNNKQMFKLVEFENYLFGYQLLAKATNGPKLFGRIKAEIETILKLIELELKK